tara:strand:+ start:39 stop:1502 length:1464 start_codon:yes stop_codon:yes gene_type:complete
MGKDLFTVSFPRHLKGPHIQLFLDLDGVLADFDLGWEKYTGAPPPRKKGAEEWAAFMAAGGSRDLPPMPGYLIIAKLLNKYPTSHILSGTPRDPHRETSAYQKREWCQRHLGLTPERVITCMSYDKPKYAWACREQGVVPILVDDREKARKGWEEAGGIFIHYPSEQRPLDKALPEGLAAEIERCRWREYISLEDAAKKLGVGTKELRRHAESWVFQEELRSNCGALEYARLEPPYVDREKAALDLIGYRAQKDLLLVGKKHYLLVLSNVDLWVAEQGKASVYETISEDSERELERIAVWLRSTERGIRLARSVIEGTWRPHPREKTLDYHESDDHHDFGDVWGLEREAYTEWAANSPQPEPIPARTWQAALSDAALFKGLLEEALVVKEKYKPSPLQEELDIELSTPIDITLGSHSYPYKDDMLEDLAKGYKVREEKINELHRKIARESGIFGGAGITQNIEILTLLIQEAEEEARQLGWDGESSY